MSIVRDRIYTVGNTDELSNLVKNFAGQRIEHPVNSIRGLGSVRQKVDHWKLGDMEIYNYERLSLSKPK
jgi:hypothetical protein